MRIKVSVRPNSGKQDINKINEKEYVIYLKSPAKQNKANIELLKLLKKHFKADKVKIIRGKSSKNKIIEVIN